MRKDKAVRVVAGTIGVFFVGLGAWAFFAPESFFERIAGFEPYNRHFVHDIGAFQIGIGVVLLFALIWEDALLVALSGAGVGSVFHLFSHVLDRDLGGRPTDLVGLGLLALVLVLATVWRGQDVGTWRRPPPDGP